MQITLHALYEAFPTRASCIAYLERNLWGDADPRCPYCRYRGATALSIESRYHCNACNTSYSVLVGTPMQGTRVDLQKWLYAAHVVVFEDPSISVRKLALLIDVNRHTAWRILKKMHTAQFQQPLLLLKLTAFTPVKGAP